MEILPKYCLKCSNKVWIAYATNKTPIGQMHQGYNGCETNKFQTNKNVAVIKKNTVCVECHFVSSYLGLPNTKKIASVITPT